MCSERARLSVVVIGLWIISTSLMHLLDLGLHLLRLVLVLHAERLILDLLRMRTGSLLRLGRHVWRPEPESDHVSEAKPPLYRPQQQRLRPEAQRRERALRGTAGVYNKDGTRSTTGVQSTSSKRRDMEAKASEGGV